MCGFYYIYGLTILGYICTVSSNILYNLLIFSFIGISISDPNNILCFFINSLEFLDHNQTY